MNVLQEIEVEAKSMEEARQLIAGKKPEGYYCISEEVLSDGIPKVSRGTGETIAEAFEYANERIPSKAEVLERKEMIAPGVTSLEIDAFNDSSARALAEQQIPEDTRVGSVEMQDQGTNGFLGIGRRPHKYAARIIQSAVVEVTYHEVARIKVSMKRLPSAAELLDTLSNLEKETGEQWLRLDKPLPNALMALMVMDSAFEYLEKSVSEPFNEILTDSKKLFVECNDIQDMDYIKLGAPDRSYDVSDIPMVSSQFKEAVMGMRRLKDLVLKET